MYCTSCGTELPNAAQRCAQCGRSVPHFPPPPTIPNYLVHSIVVALFCCLPLGIVALIYSAQVNSKLAAGDIAGARASSQKAKGWAIATLVTGIIIMACSVGLALWQ